MTNYFTTLPENFCLWLEGLSESWLLAPALSHHAVAVWDRTATPSATFNLFACWAVTGASPIGLNGERRVRGAREGQGQRFLHVAAVDLTDILVA